VATITAMTYMDQYTKSALCVALSSFYKPLIIRRALTYVMDGTISFGRRAGHKMA
jgi:hypothetical protein